MRSINDRGIRINNRILTIFTADHDIEEIDINMNVFSMFIYDDFVEFY